MKKFKLLESFIKEDILYQDDHGYIKGKMLPDGYYWVDKLYVYPEYRGKGYAKELASHIPQKAKLLAQPLRTKTDPAIDKSALINFYKSIGFEEYPDSNDNMIMIRESTKSLLKEHIEKRNGKWALVSKHTGRVLRYYHGEGYPSKEWIKKQEMEVHSFENNK